MKTKVKIDRLNNFAYYFRPVFLKREPRLSAILFRLLCALCDRHRVSTSQATGQVFPAASGVLLPLSAPSCVVSSDKDCIVLLDRAITVVTQQ